VWPVEVPALRSAATAYLARMDALADELMAVCAAALGQSEDFFAGCTRNPTSSININRYPPGAEVGPPQPGQYRIGPHTDFGTVTLLDRQSGKGGLQVCTAEGAWVDAPFVPGSLTVNIGDLLALWSGHRWRSGRHRVLPPDPTVPQEELTSLVYFGEVDVDTPVEPLAWPGVPTPEPVLSHVYLRAKLDAISIG
jgi:isopenicillin N synthase-like dioxygenase